MEKMQTALLLGSQDAEGTAHKKLESILFASIKTVTSAMSTFNYGSCDGLKRQRIILLRPVNGRQVTSLLFLQLLH
jgi:hypothetical protein